MFSTKSSSSHLNEKIVCLLNLCSNISQIADRIRPINLSQVSLFPNSLKLFHHELLSIVENSEGAAVLLESRLRADQ